MAGPQAGLRRLAHLGCGKLPSPISSCRQPPHPRQDPVIPVRPEASAEVGTEVGMLDWHRKATFQRPPAASLPTLDSWQAREGGFWERTGRQVTCQQNWGPCVPRPLRPGTGTLVRSPDPNRGFCLEAVT